MKPYSLILGGLLAMLSANGAEAQCQCGNQTMGNRSYTYQSGPPGICSVAEDVSLCSTSQIQVGPNFRLHDRQKEAMSTALQAAGVALEPEDALVIAARSPPEDWTTDQLPDVLTAMLSLSLARQAPKRLDAIGKALNERAGEILSVFGAPSARQDMRVGEYDAVVGYGFIELRQATFRARVQTPFAAALGR